MSSEKATENRTQEVSEIARGLKGIAKELSVPVIALSQLSRKTEDRGDKKPVLSDLRESGSIEQDADVVALMFREAYYKPTEFHMRDDNGYALAEDTEVNIAKNRNGPTGLAKVGFIREFARFEELAF